MFRLVTPHSSLTNLKFVFCMCQSENKLYFSTTKFLAINKTGPDGFMVMRLLCQEAPEGSTDSVSQGHDLKSNPKDWESQVSNLVPLG